jgi:hypothetical protein
MSAPNSRTQNTTDQFQCGIVSISENGVEFRVMTMKITAARKNIHENATFQCTSNCTNPTSERLLTCAEGGFPVQFGE